jgi:hypothetical protein
MNTVIERVGIQFRLWPFVIIRKSSDTLKQDTLEEDMMLEYTV